MVSPFHYLVFSFSHACSCKHFFLQFLFTLGYIGYLKGYIKPSYYCKRSIFMTAPEMHKVIPQPPLITPGPRGALLYSQVKFFHAYRFKINIELKVINKELEGPDLQSPPKV